MRSSGIALVVFAGIAALPGCKKRSADEQAKARIFSPDQPGASQPEAKEPIDANRLADDPKLAGRVLRMSQAEVAARLGPHRAETRVQFAWFRGPGLPDGGSDVALAEQSALAQGPGGDFSVREENDRNQGFELIQANGEVYVRGLFGPFHKRRTDRTEPEKVRELAMGAVPTFDRLGHGLKLKSAGEATVEGRRVVRYTVAGGGSRPEETDIREIPPVQYPLNPDGGRGPDADTARRLELWTKEQPTQLSGTVIVDAQSGALIGADLQGHFRVPGSSGAAAELDLHSVLTTSAIGKDPGIKAPEFEPAPSVPHAVKDPLRFLGKAPAAPPGAPSTEEPEEQPDEEEAPAETPAPAERARRR
jgi:hypothetical protein